MAASETHLDNLSDAMEGTVWVAAVPRWLWISVFCATASLALAGKLFLRLPLSGPILYRLEQLPFAIWWVPFLVIMALVGPWIVLRHGSRTWMRRYFPEVAALTWNGDGLHLGDGRAVTWREVKSVQMGFARRREVLVIATDAFGPQGAIHIPKTLLLDPEQALDQLSRARHLSMTRDVTSEVTAKLTAIGEATNRRLTETYGKTNSQLKAEGLPADGWLGLHSHFAREEAEKAFGTPEQA